MLSYNTLLALQLLHVLHKSGGRMMSISELRYEGLSCDPGNAAGRVMRHLRSRGWVESDHQSRYRLAVDPDYKSLLDLVSDIDGEVRLGGNTLAGYWGMAPCNELPRVSEVAERLRKDFVAALDNINLGELLAQPAEGSLLPSYGPAGRRSRASGW